MYLLISTDSWQEASPNLVVDRMKFGAAHTVAFFSTLLYLPVRRAVCAACGCWTNALFLVPLAATVVWMHAALPHTACTGRDCTALNEAGKEKNIGTQADVQPEPEPSPEPKPVNTASTASKKSNTSTALPKPKRPRKCCVNYVDQAEHLIVNIFYCFFECHGLETPVMVRYAGNLTLLLQFLERKLARNQNSMWQLLETRYNPLSHAKREYKYMLCTPLPRGAQSAVVERLKTATEHKIDHGHSRCMHRRRKNFFIAGRSQKI